jgi:cell division transport system permease protein
LGFSYINLEKPIRVKKKKLGSFPYISVVFSITMALFVVGVFGVLILHGAKLTELIRENLEINIFLNKEVTENERTKVNKMLLAKDYLYHHDGKPLIEFISKEEAAKKFIQDTGEDFLKFLGENPLRDSYIIKIKPDLYHKAKLDEIKKDIEQIDGVHEVTYQENLISSINDNLAKISLILIGLASLLIIIVIVLINSTIKLALFSQRMLIRSMQLVGATSGFIKRPFLLRALLHGLLSGLLASGLIIVLLQFSYERIEGLNVLLDIEKLFIFFGFIVVMGMIISFVSTYYSMNKYLKLSLDELY